ncbi:hypothetical protein [Streptomyces sp. NPDC091215]
MPNTTDAMNAEWMLDWASPHAAILKELGAWYQAELAKLNQS